MKKCLIILSIIFGMSLISTAVLAGKVYYTEERVYEDYDKKELDSAFLQNVYINSAVPVNVYVTKDKPYVEFNQKFVDLTGCVPEFELKVETRPEATYIDLNMTKDIYLWLGVKENQQELSVYLPQQVIEKLNIQGNAYYHSGKRTTVNLDGVDIQDLEIAMDDADVILDGNYEKISLIMAIGSATITSHTPAQLYTQGSIKQDLKGQFKKITIENNWKNINIESTYETKVSIDARRAEIFLNGKYKEITLQGDHNTVDILTDTKCQLNTQGNDNMINTSGSFDSIDMNEAISDIAIKADQMPKKMKFASRGRESNVKLTLPSNVKGFSVKYKTIDRDYGIMEDEEELNRYLNELVNQIDIESDFMLETTAPSQKEFVYTYGTGETPIVVEREYEEQAKLEIIDGGYTSKME